MNNELIWTEEKGVWRADGIGGFEYECIFFQGGIGWRALIPNIWITAANKELSFVQFLCQSHHNSLCAIRDDFQSSYKHLVTHLLKFVPDDKLAGINDLMSRERL
jgi:hypothetical protein